MELLSYQDRLRITTAATDFLLNHPKLKNSDVVLGFMLLRHTAQFGKLTDTMTRWQQQHGVGKLNRGTGISARRLATASASLVSVGFIGVSQVKGSPGSRAYTLLVDNFLPKNKMATSEVATRLRSSAAVTTLAGTGSDLDDQSTRGMEPWQRETKAVREYALALSTKDDIEELQRHLQDLLVQLQILLEPPSPKTCCNLLIGARQSRPDASPTEVVWFVRDKFDGARKDRFASWGGVVTAVREDFAKWERSGRRSREHPKVVRKDQEQPPQAHQHLKTQRERWLKALADTDLPKDRREAIRQHLAELERELADTGDAL